MSKLVFLYVLRGGGYLKVGLSTDLTRRVASMNGGTVPFPVELVGHALVHRDVALRAEMEVLSRLGRRAQGEWVFDEGATIADIVATFVLASLQMPPTYHFTFMASPSSATSDLVKQVVRAARSDARAMEASKLFERASREPDKPVDWQDFGKLRAKITQPKRSFIGPPTYKQWKKALQANTMRKIARHRAKQSVN